MRRGQIPNGYLAKHFTQLLSLSRSKSPAPSQPSSSTRELPRGVDVRLIYADYLNFLLCHTRQNAMAHTGSDPLSLSEDIDIVLTHPPQMGGAQKAVLLEAAQAAAASQGRTDARVHVVAEDEAMVSDGISCSTPMAPKPAVCAAIITPS